MKLSAKLGLGQRQGKSSCQRALLVQMAHPSGCSCLAARSTPPMQLLGHPSPSRRSRGSWHSGVVQPRCVQESPPRPAALQHRGRSGVPGGWEGRGLQGGRQEGGCVPVAEQPTLVGQAGTPRPSVGLGGNV